MKAFGHYVPGFHAGECLALATVILLALVLGIAFLKPSSSSLHPNATKTGARRQLAHKCSIDIMTPHLRNTQEWG